MALLIGIVQQLPAAGINFAGMPNLSPLFWHFLVVGWITQIIMGVSLWMFPSRKRGKPGGMTAGWIAFAGINLGLVLRGVAEPFTGSLTLAGQWALVLSALLQVAGGISYVIGIWSRVKGKQHRKRNRKKKSSS